MTDVRPIKSVNWNMKTNHQYIPKPKIAGGNIKATSHDVATKLNL